MKFKDGLKKLSFITDDLSGGYLKFTSDSVSDVYEKLHIEEAKKYKADAIYFKSIQGQPSCPQVYVYDNTSLKKDTSGLADLHYELWNSCLVPLFIVFNKTEVKLFNCYQKPKFEETTGKFITNAFKTIVLAGEIDKEFSAAKLSDGSFWYEKEVKKNFSRKNSAYETLLHELKRVREDIRQKGFIKDNTLSDKLLVKSILIKYLEERKVFKDSFWKKYLKDASEFKELFANNKTLLRMFTDLSNHFNGGIFRFSPDEIKILEKSNLNEFGNFFASDSKDGQMSFWQLYSFENLPVELISNIYEEFLDNVPGVVYTPPILVNFLINEVMPLDKPQENYKVLDPACGSGVFLVAVYKRLIQWWRIKHNWRKPTLQTLKKILRESVYGIDVNEEAIELTVFSLSLALCDELTPKAIWNELQFDNLKKCNLIADNFFNCIENKNIHDTFDLVVGNPPFKSKLNDVELEFENQKKKIRVPLPDKQIALLFLEQSQYVCKKNGYICLIQPSEPLLYNYNSQEFKRHLLKQFQFIQIVDFSPLREVLFGKANAAILGVFIKNIEPNKNKKILHTIVRRTLENKEKLYFILNHYDCHWIDYEVALENRYIWKINYLGGGRLSKIIDKSRCHTTIKGYVQSMGWSMQEGFTIGANKAKLKKVPELKGLRFIPANALDENGIDKSKINTLKTEFFYRPKKRECFRAPLILIKQLIRQSFMPIDYVTEDIAYSDRFIGINVKGVHLNKMKNFVKVIQKNKLFTFFCLFNGSALIGRGNILEKKDIELLPFPEDIDHLKLSKTEKILVEDTVDYMIEFRNKGENASVLQEATTKQLQDFGKVYCDLLNTIYKEFKPMKPVCTESFHIYSFYYGKKPPQLPEKPKDLEKHLTQLLVKQTGSHITVNRVLRLYEKNTIYLVKPKQLWYWLKSIAVRDADETFADLVKQGY